MIALAVFLFVASSKSMDYYRCLLFHYPERFVEVELYEDPQDNSPSPSVLDKGKAIYDRRYIYNNKVYRTEIAQREFDDRFYICEDMPFRVYSETDLETPSKDLLLSIMMIVIGVALIIMAIYRLVTGIRKRLHR